MSDRFRPVGAPNKRDTILRRACAFLVWLLYRDVTVYRAPGSEVGSAPLLTAANHFGGFLDPLLLMAVMQRRPRIIARDRIWKVPFLGWFMRWIGAIPVHKPEESGPNRNDAMFGTAYDALRNGQHLMIFPEGVTRDDPSIASIKTGAARIALGARAHGTPGIKIVPAGIHYEDKAALRSRVFINLGPSLDVDTFVEEHAQPDEPVTAENREAVRELTADIEQRLRSVAPDFADWPQASALAMAASVFLRANQDDPLRPVAIADRERLAGHLSAASEAERAPVVEAVTTYDEVLSSSRLDDVSTYQRVSAGKLGLHILWNVIVVAVLLPFALVGLTINAVPAALTWAVGRIPLAPAVMATVKPIFAIVAFGAAWAISVWAAFEQWGLQGGLAMLLLMPVYLLSTIVVSERIVLLWRSIRWWFRSGRSQKLQDEIVTDRQAVVDTVRKVLGTRWT